MGRCSVCCGVGLSHKDHRFKRKKKRNQINSLSEGQQRAPWHMRKRRHEKGQFLKHKRKEKKKKRSKWCEKWAGFCQRFGWRWSFWLNPGLTPVGRRHQQDAAAVHRVTRTYTLWPQLSAHQRFRYLYFPSLSCVFLWGLFFPHIPHERIYTRCSVLEYSVGVIFIKILPSTLNTKCSGNSAGRTRGFGFLLAFTPGVKDLRLNQIPGWNYDLKINQSSCPSWCCCDLVEWICLNTDSVTPKKTKTEELRIETHLLD